jgi:hypothetical protein
MPEEFDYGPRLTDEEYERRVVDLQRQLPRLPGRDLDAQVRRRQLDLAIDHRLGCNFPQERREALWAIQQDVERRRLRLAFKYFVRKVFRKALVKDAQALAGYVVDEYAKVLTEAELRSFFGLRKGERPALPVDMSHLK